METATVQKGSLWQNHNFLKLWTSETISQFGSQFTGLALPLTAIIILNADSTELGILTFAGTIPWLIFGLLVGVWVDRHRKQRIMVASNILRGSILALIPIAAVLGVITKLGISFLYAVSFFVGFLQVFFDITYQSYLPSLVRRDQLVEGNRNLQASASTAQVTGPTIAGIIISIITAPIAIAIDACSFFASAFTLGRIDHEETIDKEFAKPSVLADIREGLHVVLSDSRLRMIAGSTGTSNFFSTALGAIVLLYLVLPSPAGLVVYNVNQVSLRQAIVPLRLQGRMNATMRFLVWGTIPLGGLTGGLLGTFLGLRTAIGIAVLGGSLAFLWVLLSPVRSLKKIPEPLE